MYLFPHNPIFFLILNFALHYERLVSSNNYYLNFEDEKKNLLQLKIIVFDSACIILS